MPNILDLKKKEIQIVEKIVLKKRLWYIETLKMLGVLAITISVTWAFSNASLFTEETDETPAPLKQRIPKFSAIGIVSLITDDTISLSDAHGTKSEDTTFTFEISSISKIETKSYDPLSLSDILVGDKVIVQGTLDENEEVIPTRIISFGVVAPAPLPEEIPPLEPALTEGELPLTGQAEVLGESTEEPVLEPQPSPEANQPVDEEADQPSAEEEVTSTLEPSPDETLTSEPSPELPPAEEPSLEPAVEGDILPEVEETEEVIETPEETPPPAEPEVTLPEEEPVVETPSEEVPPTE